MNVTQYMLGRATLQKNQFRGLWVKKTHIISSEGTAGLAGSANRSQPVIPLEGKWETSLQKNGRFQIFSSETNKKQCAWKYLILGSDIFLYLFQIKYLLPLLNSLYFCQLLWFGCGLLFFPTLPTKRATAFPNKAIGSCLSLHVVMPGLCVKGAKETAKPQPCLESLLLSPWRNVRMASVTHPREVSRG